MKRYNTIDNSECGAASDAASGLLSGYIGTDPYGGIYCRKLEFEWQQAFKVKHAIAVNSATSGLLAACMAIGIDRGDEVIVSPYTMSATAAAPKILGANIIWADIEPETYTIDPKQVEISISRKTRAVIATNLFGHPAHLHELRKICDENGVFLIEDNAQSIFAQESGAYTGTIGHIGVFSLNVHKQLQVGEGGICVTNQDTLAKKLREAMNHGEMRGGILGLNLRMTEVTAAMAREQLKKSDQIIMGRCALWHELTLGCMARRLPIATPHIRSECIISAYAWAAQLQKKPSSPLPVPFRKGYMKPLYTLPAFAEPAFEKDTPHPVVERVERHMILVELCAIDPTGDEIDEMLDALEKVL